MLCCLIKYYCTTSSFTHFSYIYKCIVKKIVFRTSLSVSLQRQITIPIYKISPYKSSPIPHYIQTTLTHLTPNECNKKAILKWKLTLREYCFFASFHPSPFLFASFFFFYLHPSTPLLSRCMYLTLFLNNIHL